MNNLTINKIFLGYCDIVLPKDFDMKKSLIPTVLSDEVTCDSLLFVTEKVMQKDDVLDCSTLSITPYALVVSHTREVKNASLPIIRVGNVREALSYALSNAYEIDYNKVNIIGVTGTNGKTTTASLIYNILRDSGYIAGFIGTGKIEIDGLIVTDDFYSMTTPDPTLLYPTIKDMIVRNCQYIIMEVSSHSIALGKIAPIKFKYSIFTNLDDDHLDFHKDKNEYFKTKLKLFSISEKGLFNLDDEYSSKAYLLASCQKSSFGIINIADAYATEIKLDGLLGCSFFYRADNLIFKAQSRLIGAFNVYNILAALKCVIDLGIKPCIAKRALSISDDIDGRMNVIDGRTRAIIDYAHTPNAFKNCLKTIKQNIKSKQRLIVIFGCGGNRDTAKRPIFGKVAEEYADMIIITEDNSRNENFFDIANEISSGIKRKPYTIIENRKEAIYFAMKNANDGDVVAIIGKGHEKYIILNGDYIPFNERKIIEDIIWDEVICE